MLTKTITPEIKLEYDAYPINDFLTDNKYGLLSKFGNNYSFDTGYIERIAIKTYIPTQIGMALIQLRKNM
jgi:hypothetical protein